MRAFKYISDPKAFEIIADETRRRMIYLLRAKEQTVSQLAESLGKTPQAIYHQIRKLVDAGLVEVAREERVDHFIETYYRAAGEVFEFWHVGTTARQFQKELKEALESLEAVGLTVRVDKELIRKMAEIETKHSAIGLRPEMEEKISQLGDVGFLVKQELYKLVQHLTMSDKQFEEMLSNERELRELLKSSLKKGAQSARSEK
jgi:DNA-binding transcriptional ArsR family regulator